MWRKPELDKLIIPQEMKDLMKRSIYWNSTGHLVSASMVLKFQYSFLIGVFGIFTSFIAYYAISSLLSFIPWLGISLGIIIALILFSLQIFFFYRWGWRNFREAWYYFNHKDELFVAIKETKEGWQEFEIPFEEISEVSWFDGPNGLAIIKVGNYEFETSRALVKNKSSVTELWDDLARIGAPMREWPIELICSKCKREFGHHIGTAVCPYDRTLLIEPNLKGRIDPEEIHPDDLDRI
jgi:hypothetical protein